MKVAEYNEFVHRTDQYKEKPTRERQLIALYGLVGEIGSLLSTVKKKLLAESGEGLWNYPNEEIIEEIGDVAWYCFSLAQIANENRPINILKRDITLLRQEIGVESERAKKIHAALDPTTRAAFLKAAEVFPSNENLGFDDYQRLAFLTARTKGRDLLEVCLAVLWQLGAELLRNTLPEIEITLNKNVADRSMNIVLGEIAWHLAAVATLYDLSMDAVIEKNVAKVSFRSKRDQVTPLHDADREPHEQFPRKFDIAFVSIGRGRSRMYHQARRLGDDLTDNAYTDDGYRFHDVMHLANVAHLGWSPVVRKLLGRKRKSRNDQVDEVEDGARALIVEELVLKAIHSEGVRLAQDGGHRAVDGPTRTFPVRSAITFKLLKSLRNFVEGLEVSRNQHWEWEDAIYEGSEVFFQLRTEGQGTVVVDLNKRKLSFSPDVCVEIKGAAVGLGIGNVPTDVGLTEIEAVLTRAEVEYASGRDGIVRTVAAKRAIIGALGWDAALPQQWHLIKIKLLDGRRVCVKATGAIRERMWLTGTIAFQLAFAVSPNQITCTAIAVADVEDLVS